MNPLVTALPLQETLATVVSKTRFGTDGVIGIRMRIPWACLIRFTAGICASSETRMSFARMVTLGLPLTEKIWLDPEVRVGAPIAIVWLSVAVAAIVLSVIACAD